MSFEPQHSVYVIAEAGVNHNGQLDLAMQLVDAAASAGADAVKFQTFQADRLASTSAPKASYQTQTTAANESQHAMLKKLELPFEWHAPLQQHAKKQGITFLSTPFDMISLGFLQTLQLPLLKVSSGDLTNAPFLWACANSGVPLVVSTGMATLSEVEHALAVIHHSLHHINEPQNMEAVWSHWVTQTDRSLLTAKVTLLHCTSQYPTPMNEVNLYAMDTLRHAFHLPVGYSDHTQGTVIPIAAVARGARVIEKHLTLDCHMQGPDHRASLEPDEFGQMVKAIRQLEVAMGHGHKAPQPSELNTRLAARKQVVAARPIAKGQTFTREDLETARSGQGLPPQDLWQLIGCIAQHDFATGEAIQI
jgi:N-acetylneuraminate synthase